MPKRNGIYKIFSCNAIPLNIAGSSARQQTLATKEKD